MQTEPTSSTPVQSSATPPPAAVPPGSPPASPGTTADASTPAEPGQRKLIFDPSTESPWVQPKYAFWVVAIVSVVILAILGVSIFEIEGTTTGSGEDQVRTADPNAGTIAALAAAAFTALSTLTAAYFGIKIASEQSDRANATASRALQVADNAHHANSTANGNPTPADF